MIFGFFVCAAGAELCALAVSAAAAAAVVPNMNSRRLVGNANSLLNITAVSRLDLSEVILQAKLQLARIVWIVARRADRCEGVGVGERQIPWLSEVWGVGQVEYLSTE